MSIRKEAEKSEISRFTNRERDFDIHTLENVGDIVDSLPGSRFIVTGSYAVEALTGAQLIHDDMDSNIFSDNVERDLPQVATMLGEQQSLTLYKRTEDRLEYDVSSDEIEIPRRLEIQFVEVENIPNEVSENGLEFAIRNQNMHSVTTVHVPIADSTGKSSLIRVKTLSYLIATWVIRISGVTENPKREIRNSDLDHLRLLLTGDYNREDIISAMSRHPQMPTGLLEENIFNTAIKRISD